MGKHMDSTDGYNTESDGSASIIHGSSGSGQVATIPNGDYNDH